MRAGRLGGCAAALVVGCLLVGACSSDTSTGGAATTATTAPARLDKAEYLRRANEICAAMQRRLDAMEEPSQDPAKAADQVAESLAISRQTLAQLRALPPPAGEEEAFERYHDEVDALMAKGDELVAAFRSGDNARINAAGQAFQDSSTKVNDLAGSLGEDQCGT